MWREWILPAYIITVVNILLAIGATIHAVLWKRDSRAVIGWVGLAWLAPIVGSVAYFCLGINRIERKAETLKLQDSPEAARQAKARWIERAERDQAIAADFPHLAGLSTAVRRITGLSAVPGNDVQLLVDGDQAYPEMLAAIDGARLSVGLLSYIFDNDRAGNAFLDALLRAHQRGVEVRVLIDDVGSKYSRPNMVRRLQGVGLAAAGFLPTRVPRFFKYANLRNHRKILVVDGTVGFTGGTNIREGHWLSKSPKDPVQCLHFRLQGPVVGQIQRVFVSDWAFATGEKLAGQNWFPEIDHTGSVWARGIEDGPDEHFQIMANTIAAGLASARYQVRIVTPYFLPNDSLIQALNVTALRGVDVEVYLPSANNIALVQWAATAQMWQFLEKGCRIFYTSPPFDHTKLMVVDGTWTLIGSTNWDPRSLRLNFEFNVECYDQRLASELNEIVDRKAASAHEITLDEVNGRRFPVRLRDGLARLFTPYL